MQRGGGHQTRVGSGRATASVPPAPWPTSGERPGRTPTGARTLLAENIDVLLGGPALASTTPSSRPTKWSKYSRQNNLGFVPTRATVVIVTGMVGIAEPAASRCAALRPHLDERQRRPLLGVEAQRLGRGGIKAIADATGTDRAAPEIAGRDQLATTGPRAAPDPPARRRPHCNFHLVVRIATRLHRDLTYIRVAHPLRTSLTELDASSSRQPGTRAVIIAVKAFPWER